METVSQSRLYRLAKRLSLGRFLRYLDLWARYGWRRGQSALSARLRRQLTDTASVAAALAEWIPLLPPEKPRLYVIRFYAALDSGARLEARGLLTVVAGQWES